jgi:Mg-chelatase subunit ChlD
MNWLPIPITPWTGIWLALAVIPPLIILYFLKLRRRPQPISCTILWKKSVEDLRANAPFQKLRRSLLLFLQLLALALLAFSVMQPQIQAGNQVGGKIVLMIDNSASMTANDAAEGDSSRLEEAKRRARERVEELYGAGLFASSTGETMVVVFSDGAEILSRFTSSKQQLLSAIDTIQPAHGETNMAEALKLARAYTTNTVDEAGEANRPIDDPPTIELYSDGRVADLADQVLRGETLTYHAIGSLEADNVAISAISVERPFDRPTSVQVFVAMLNFNTQPVTCDMQVSVNGRARGIQTVEVSAAHISESNGQLVPGRANVVFTPFEQPRDAVIEVANLREDNLAADNVAQVVVPPPRRLKVAIVAESRSLIRRALEGIKFEKFQSLTPDQYEKSAAEGALDAFDLIVLDNYAPKLMPPNRYLTFGLTPPVEGFHDFGEGAQQIILSARDEHPVMRFVNHDNVFISRFRLIQPSREVKVLWEGSGGPAMLAVSRGPLQVIHVPFDPLESNWPFQRSFVTFLFNAVDFLGNAGEALTSKGLMPGEAITTRLPANAADITLQLPDGSTQEITPLEPGAFAWGPIRLAGLYTLSWTAPGSDERFSRTFAVNLLSETEGRIAVNPVVEVGQDKVAGRRADESAYTPLWPYAIALCLAVLMVEWWVYHRKAFI